jgi:hypothetical protein
MGGEWKGIEATEKLAESSNIEVTALIFSPIGPAGNILVKGCTVDPALIESLDSMTFNYG